MSKFKYNYINCDEIVSGECPYRGIFNLEEKSQDYFKKLIFKMCRSYFRCRAHQKTGWPFINKMLVN